MGKVNVSLQQLNRGIISPLALARTDIDRLAFSAEEMVNWMPRVLGSMMLRPGLKYLGSTSSNAAARFIPFVFSTDDTALIEITDSQVRIWESETPVTRANIASSISNGEFTSLTTWTDLDDAGGSSSLYASTYLSLIGDGTNAARRRATVNWDDADVGVTMAIKVNVYHGPVTLRVGTANGTDNYVAETSLETGYHSIAFTPLGSFVVELESALAYEVLVDSCTLSDNETLTLTAPWATADLNKIRYHQSGDVVFIACEGYQQRIIERRGAGSWSLIEYKSDDGPYLAPNVTNTTIISTGLTGNVTLTASDPIFGNISKNQLYEITSDGQAVSSDISAENTFTNTIKVSGVDSQRVFTIQLTGTWAGTVALQRSFESEDGPFEDTTSTWTANTIGSYDDTLDNQIIWYRLGIKTGFYTSGTVTASLDYPIGSIRGVARVVHDKYDWRAVDSQSGSWRAMEWAPSIQLFCAVAQSGANVVMTSPDGATWTARTAPSTYSNLVWSESLTLFVAVSVTGTGNRVSTSPDGITWTARTSAADNTWESVCWSPELTLFVAVASSGTGNRVMTSPDGITWTSRTSAEDNSWSAVCWSSYLSLFVAVATDGTNRVMTSSDGITWATASAAAANEWRDVIWVPELLIFVAVASSGTNDGVMTSVNGTTWTSRTTPTVGSGWRRVRWAADLGYMVASASFHFNFIRSEDGVTWTSTPVPAQNSWYSLTYSPYLQKFASAALSGSATDSVIFTSSNRYQVYCEVVKDLGGTNATTDWSEGSWSDYRGWPSSVTLTEGRLFWAGKNGIYGSVSDDYYNFNPETEGDSAPINRTIGIGPVDTINWLLPLQRLLIGAEGSEIVGRSSSFDEPLTRTNFNLRLATDQGSSRVEAVRIDRMGVFVQRGGTRIIQMVYDGGEFEFNAQDLTLLSPEVCQPQVVRIAVQRQPDTRVHCVLSDGTVAILIYDRAEDVKCWVKVETDGTVEDVVVLPGDDGDSEDKVYYVVNRTISGSTFRYLEKWAKESDCIGGTLNHQADSYLSVSQASSTTITGLSHLAGETVSVWANGKNLGTYTVSGGAITVSEAVTTAIVGLGYTATWKSSKLAYGARQGTALLQKKTLKHLGVILQNTHYQGLEYGPDFTTMDNLPLTKNGAIISADTVHSSYDQETFEFPGEWNTDSRLCLRATAPKPCTILAAVMGIETNEKF